MKKNDTNKKKPTKNLPIPDWKKKGFKSQREFDEWLNEMYEDIRHGTI